jgi:signal transduction histidine kinase
VALLAAARLKDRVEPGAANELEQVAQLIDNVLETTRSLTVQLSPPVLYELGLSAALRWLGTQLLEPRGIAVRTTVNVASVVSEQVRVVAFNAVRELYLNILKHSEARTVELSVQEQAGLLHATILDDGIGLDPSRWRAAPTREDHFGLFNLREQLRHMGGSMELQSEIGHFTRVRLTLPLNVESTATTNNPGDSYGQHS